MIGYQISRLFSMREYDFNFYIQNEIKAEQADRSRFRAGMGAAANADAKRKAGQFKRLPQPRGGRT